MFKFFFLGGFGTFFILLYLSQTKGIAITDINGLWNEFITLFTDFYWRLIDSLSNVTRSVRGATVGH